MIFKNLRILYHNLIKIYNIYIKYNQYIRTLPAICIRNNTLKKM